MNDMSQKKLEQFDKNDASKQKRIDELESLIVKYKDAYYAGSPLVSDAEYDRIEEELRKLSPKSEVLSMVGAETEGGVTHDPPMLSINKVKNIDEAVAWADHEEIVWGYKADGTSVNLDYADGRLIGASTRGDGFIGENVTRHAMVMGDVPRTVNIKTPFKVRGEAYIPLSTFVTLGEFKSPRNLATGTLNLKEATLTKQRNLRLMAWDLIVKDKPMTYVKKIENLKRMGFITADQGLVEPSEMIELYSDITSRRDTFDFDMDGLVFKMNDPDVQARMGETSHHPRWIIAVKFPPKEDSTMIKNIVWQIGRSGKITPVAEVNPIDLSGATISRATMHNARFVLDNKIAVGDTVFIVRSGDVIPKIVGVASHGKNSVVLPKVCPVCGCPVEFDGVTLWCRNKNCGEAQLQGIIHFVQTVGMEGLGTKTLQALWDDGKIKSAADLYELDKLYLTRTFGINGGKIYDNIQSAKDIPLDVFLVALNIPSIGPKAAKAVAGEVDDPSQITPEVIRRALGPDSVAARNMVEWFQSNGDPSNVYVCMHFIRRRQAVTACSTGSPISGKKIYVTGSVANMDKSQVEEFVTQHGGNWSSPGKSLDYLIVGEKPGPAKIAKATEWGVKMISWKKFIEMVGE